MYLFEKLCAVCRGNTLRRGQRKFYCKQIKIARRRDDKENQETAEKAQNYKHKNPRTKMKKNQFNGGESSEFGLVSSRISVDVDYDEKQKKNLPQATLLFQQGAFASVSVFCYFILLFVFFCIFIHNPQTQETCQMFSRKYKNFKNKKGNLARIESLLIIKKKNGKKKQE